MRVAAAVTASRSEIDMLKPSSSRYAMLLLIDLLATEVALRQAERSQELLRRIKYMLDARRGGGDRQPLGD